MDNININNKTAIIAITKNGIAIAKKIQDKLNDSDIYVPDKYSTK